MENKYGTLKFWSFILINFFFFIVGRFLIATDDEIGYENVVDDYFLSLDVFSMCFSDGSNCDHLEHRNLDSDDDKLEPHRELDVVL
jgi:hypothetical protein